MSQRVERVLLAMILSAFVVLGIVYSVIVPPFEASDELKLKPFKYAPDLLSLQRRVMEKPPALRAPKKKDGEADTKERDGEADTKERDGEADK